MDLDSCDSHESQAATVGTDVASTVFGFAPYWMFSYSWHCQHPSDTSLDPSFIQFSEPQTTEEVLQLYRNRQMKGSNLVVGLSSGDIASSKTIPSTFFRTLAYVFEVAKSGQTYAPLTEDDLQRGAPVKGWCEPLWLRSSEGGLSSDNDDQEPCQDPAQQLLTSAPYWCYLYNHDPSRAKKTPPKEADQILAMYRSGSLPDWTPVLGLQHDVSTFNSLPPSLFMPLGTLLHLAATGYPCRAVGLAELTRWDKFISSRTSNGYTQGVLQPGVPTRSSRGHSHSSGTFTSTATAMQSLMSGGADPGIPGHGNHSQLASNYYHNQHGHQQLYNSYCAPHNYMPYQMHPNSQMYPSPSGGPPNAPPAASTGMAPMMWGCGQYPVPSQSDPNPNFGSSQFSMENPTSLACGKGPLHVDRSGWNTHTNNSSLQRGSRRSSSGKKGNATGLGHGQQGPYSLLAPLALAPGNLPQAGAEATARHWQTALFRLFTADATRGSAHSVWWTMAPEGGNPTGPFGCEQMVVDYARGILADSNLVCGTTADAPANIAPGHDLFEDVGSLLVQPDLDIVQPALMLFPVTLWHSSSALNLIVYPGMEQTIPSEAKPQFSSKSEITATGPGHRGPDILSSISPPWGDRTDGGPHLSSPAPAPHLSCRSCPASAPHGGTGQMGAPICPVQHQPPICPVDPVLHQPLPAAEQQDGHVGQGGHYVLVTPQEVMESMPTAHLGQSNNVVKQGAWCAFSRDTDSLDATAKVKNVLSAFNSGNKGHKKGGRGDSNRDQKPRTGGDPMASHTAPDAMHPQDTRSKYNDNRRLGC
eukprot:gene21016-27881_t